MVDFGQVPRGLGAEEGRRDCFDRVAGEVKGALAAKAQRAEYLRSGVPACESAGAVSRKGLVSKRM